METQPETPTKKQATILIADDIVDVSGPMTQILHIFCPGARILCATDGEAALGMIRANGGVDLLISDVDMPNMTGPQLVEKVSQEFPDTMTILISGNPAPAGHKAKSFLMKPLDMPTIRRMVEGFRP